MFKKKSVRARRGGWVRKFEALEDRRLLTIFNVTTVADVVNPSDGKLSLREAIDLANAHPGADTIVLKAGPNAYKITIAGGGEDNNQTGDFDITDDLTIKSAGSGFPTIGGNGLDRVFDMVGDGLTLTLNHVIVTGGIARTSGGGGGGGIHGTADETLILNNTTVKNNIATSPGEGVGGGIALDDDSDLTLNNSHVDNNSAAAGVSGSGGGIHMIGPSGNLTIKNSTVNNNSSYNDGGGIADFSIDKINIVNSQINNNHAGSGPGGGLATVAQFVTITGSTINGNTAAEEGGGLEINFGSTGTIDISKSNFSNNTSGFIGGAVWGDGATTTLTGCNFQNNTSTGGPGGAFGEFSDLHVTDCTFIHNVALEEGGALAQWGRAGDITILRSTFTQNASLTSQGGAIAAAGAAPNVIKVTDSKFNLNSANTDGGAIEASNETYDLLRSTFDHNTAVTGFGGALHQGTVLATDCTFTYNTAKADGGAIDSIAGSISLTRCLVSCNTATNGQGGGLVDGDGSFLSRIVIEDSTIDGNTAGGNGGGFAATGQTLIMTGSTVSNNRSGSDGGGAYIVTSGLDVDSQGSSIINCTFSGNGSATDGGGISFEGDGDLTIYYCTIVFNSSFNGGGIAQTGGAGTIHIGNSIVAKNNATNDPDAYNASSQPFDDLGHNLVFADPDSFFSDPNSDDIFNLAPLLGPLANNGGPTKTHALLKNSPALNAADGSLLPISVTVDQRGFKRPKGPAPDIGAFEKQ